MINAIKSLKKYANQLSIKLKEIDTIVPACCSNTSVLQEIYMGKSFLEKPLYKNINTNVITNLGNDDQTITWTHNLDVHLYKTAKLIFYPGGLDTLSDKTPVSLDLIDNSFFVVNTLSENEISLTISEVTNGYEVTVAHIYIEYTKN